MDKKPEDNTDQIKLLNQQPQLIQQNQLESLTSSERYKTILNWIEHDDLNIQLAFWLRTYTNGVWFISKETLEDEYKNPSTGHETITLMNLKFMVGCSITFNCSPGLNDPFWVFTVTVDGKESKMKIMCDMIGSSGNSYKISKLLYKFCTDTIFNDMFLDCATPRQLLDFLIRMATFSDVNAGYSRDTEEYRKLAKPQLTQMDEKDFTLSFYWGGEKRVQFRKESKGILY